MKMLTACTYEMDDPNLAVAEILRQLDLEHTLCRNAVGIMHCFSDFISSGVIQAVCDAVPFDVVGTTGMEVSVSGEIGPMMLNLTVLTSDDVEFAACTTGPIEKLNMELIRHVYHEAYTRLSSAPALMLVYAPLNSDIGEHILGVLDEESKRAPIFGMVATDSNGDYHDAYTMFNGVCDRDAMSIVLMSGNVHPRFFMTSIRDEKIQGQGALITKSEKNIVHEVNGRSFLEYLESFGISKGKGLEGIAAIPFLINNHDGTAPLARVVYRMEENGSGVFGCDMPEGATLTIGSLDYEDVRNTAHNIIAEVMEKEKNASGMLIYPCVSRAYVLGTDPDAEFRVVGEAINGRLPYTICYAGGEICPQYRPEGGLINRFHNFTFVVCIL